MAINGNKILVYKAGVLIAGTRSNEVQTEADLIEVSAPTYGQWRQYISGRKQWSVTVNYLVSAEGVDITSLLDVGEGFRLEFKHRDSDEGAMQGVGMLKTCRITATKGNLVQGTFQFVGSGALKTAVNLLSIKSGWQDADGNNATYDTEQLGVQDPDGDLYAPKVWVSSGQTVCFSCGYENVNDVIFCTSATSYTKLSDYSAYGQTTTKLLQNTTTPNGEHRSYATLTVPSACYVVCNIPYNDWVYKPQLEIGDEPTNFDEPEN